MWLDESLTLHLWRKKINKFAQRLKEIVVSASGYIMNQFVAIFRVGRCVFSK